MKIQLKLTAILLFCIIAFIVCSCGGDDGSGTTPPLTFDSATTPGEVVTINVGSEIGYAEYSSYKGRRSQFCQYLREKVSGLHC